jgi:hypothetical protein
VNKLKIAVAGAGIYGATIAIHLAARGAEVHLFDPLGVMKAASVINQFRIHKGFHYPRSAETIREILESRESFIEEYKDAVFYASEQCYAIPHEGSLTSCDAYEHVYDTFKMKLKKVRPSWINFEFIDSCYAVDESIYDPTRLTELVEKRISQHGVMFHQHKFTADHEQRYDFSIYATYGSSGSHSHLFDAVELQVAEKILIRLPAEIQGKSLVVVDGPFTAFDPYGSSPYSQFGSAKHTNHWKSPNPEDPIPEQYAKLLNRNAFDPVDFTRFEEMRRDAALSVPLCAHAEYLGSRFTLRLVEADKVTDRRVLKISRQGENVFHVFSGKVVGAAKAARVIADELLG